MEIKSETCCPFCGGREWRAYILACDKLHEAYGHGHSGLAMIDWNVDRRELVPWIDHFDECIHCGAIVS